MVITHCLFALRGTLFEGTVSLSASRNTCTDGLSPGFGHTLASKDHFQDIPKLHWLLQRDHNHLYQFGTEH